MPRRGREFESRRPRHFLRRIRKYSVNFAVTRRKLGHTLFEPSTCVGYGTRNELD